jgi:hexokinase
VNISIDEITVFKDHGYILVQSHNDSYSSEFESTINKLSALSSEYGVTKVLVDSRKRQKQPSTIEQLESGEYLGEFTHRILQIAILIPTLKEDQSFHGDVCVNHGAKVCFFASEEKAKKWLDIQE